MTPDGRKKFGGTGDYDSGTLADNMTGTLRHSYAC